MQNQPNDERCQGAKSSRGSGPKFGYREVWHQSRTRYRTYTVHRERRPNKISEKTVEQKINKHRTDLIRKNTGDKKIKRERKQADDISVVSSGRSYISSASNVAHSLKMRILK